MKTKLRFKVIASLIIVSLIALFISQAYWIRNLYNSIWETTQTNIGEAMKMADYKELYSRIERIKEAEGENREKREIQYDISLSNNQETDTVPTTENQKNNDSLESLSELLAIVDNLERGVLSSMHIAIDSLHPVDISLYDQLLSIELKERNISEPYTLRLIQLKDSTPHTYMSINSKKKAIKHEFGLTDKGYDYPLLSRSDQIYRLYIKSPEKIVFRQMSGILFSSGLLIVLIIFSFAYMFRTILKQKTVEELKTDFTNNVTHELKTPIAVAYAANDVLLHHEPSTSEKQKKYMTIIQEQLSRLTGMVEQILTLSVENRSTLKLHPEKIRIADLLPSLLELYKLKTDKEIIFTNNLPDNLTIYADRTHLYNMIGNLIENAVKYTTSQQVCITFTAEVTKKETVFSVTDNGIGISEANQKRIFDKFYRVPQGNRHDVKGYGLGLYYINDMMTRHHGSVSVTSQPGAGATFTLHFKNH